MTGENIPTPETDKVLRSLHGEDVWDFETLGEHAKKQERELSRLRDSFNRQRKNYTDLYAAIVGSDDGASVGDIDPFEVANQLRTRAETAEGELKECTTKLIQSASTVVSYVAEKRCRHKWIGDTCTHCGVAYHIAQENEIAALRAENAELRAKLGGG